MDYKDNSDVHVLIDGKLVDQRIEALIEHLKLPIWSDPALPDLFNEIVREFVKPNCVWIPIYNSNPEPYVFGLTFFCAVRGTRHWPKEFDANPMIQIAVAVAYPNLDEDGDEQYTLYAGGASLQQALYLAVAQYARERSIEMYSQGTLRLS